MSLDVFGFFPIGQNTRRAWFLLYMLIYQEYRRHFNNIKKQVQEPAAQQFKAKELFAMLSIKSDNSKQRGKRCLFMAAMLKANNTRKMEEPGYFSWRPALWNYQSCGFIY